MSVTIATVQAEVPGLLGLLPDDDGIRALMRFEEVDDSIAPAEDLGVLSAVRPAGTFPAVVDGYTSRARDFDGTTGIQATDADGRALLERTVSIVAILEWDHAATSGPDAIAAHGVGGSALERRSWHLRLSKPSAGVGRVQWVWEDRAGVEHAQTGADFFLPASGYMLVAATREWAGDHFELRYWIGETLLGALATTDIEVGGGLGATVTIGCAGDGVGGFVERFHGRIDQVAIFSEALTQAQVSHFWQRIAVWPADVYAAARDLQPPGDARSRDPQSLVQRRIRVHSGLFAATAALVALRADAGLPDRAYGRRLALWERATGQVARPGESIATRRERVLAALRGEQGLTADAIIDNLAPLYGLDPAELELMRFDNITRGVDYPAWTERGDGAVLVAAPDDAVTLRVKDAASYSTVLGGYSYRTAALSESIITVVVESTTLSNDDLFVGFANHRDTDQSGIKLDTSAGQVVNTLSGANIQAYTTPVELLVFLDAGEVKARIDGGAAITLGAAPAALSYAEVALVPTSASPPGTARSALLSDLRVQNRDSRQTQVGYVYAAAAEDLLGARRQLARQQPAHVFAAALTTRALRCSDADNGVEVAPLVETQANAAQAMLGDGVARAWAGTAVDLIAGALLAAGGSAAIDADEPGYGPFGDQALVMTAGNTDTWVLPAGGLDFPSSRATALVLVYFISAYTPGTEYTLLGNREGADLNGVEVAISTTGTLLVRFDPGAGALVELELQAASTEPGWHGLVVHYDPDAGLITAATEIQAITAAFAGDAASATAAALGAYRGLPTPAWRSGVLAVLEDAAAVAITPVATAVYHHRAWANLFDHPEELRRFVGIDVDVMWSGSTIDDVALHPLLAENGATIVAGTYGALTGPYVMSLAATQAWATQSADVVQMDTRSALFILAVDLTSFTAAVFNTFFGNVTGAGSAGIELTISTSGRVTFNADDDTGPVVGVQLPSLSNTASGKHVYVVQWNATTGVITLASELESNTGSFLDRDATSAGMFRLGSFRGLVSAVFQPLFFAAIYHPDTESIDPHALAVRLHQEI